MIKITDEVSIPEDELKFTASRSSGPGGQNVNKVSSRVTLWFDVIHSPHLTEDQKRLIMSRLGTRVNKDGVLWIASQQTRSQSANRELAIRRFVELLQGALRRTAPRKETRTPKGAVARRLDEKRHRGLLKQERSGKAIREE